MNHRTDLRRFYGARGFRETGTKPLDELHNCGPATLTRPAHFVNMSKDLT